MPARLSGHAAVGETGDPGLAPDLAGAVAQAGVDPTMEGRELPDAITTNGNTAPSVAFPLDGYASVRQHRRAASGHQAAVFRKASGHHSDQM